MPPAQRPAHLAPSELGTKQYWDNLYAAELSNHASNPQDTGTVWFDDADAEAKMVQFLTGLDDAGELGARAVLDLGCGNGSLLRAVREELYAAQQVSEDQGGEHDSGSDRRPRLLGVDYSEASISLAESITKGVDEEEEDDDDAAVPIEFLVWDMLQGSADELVPDGQPGSSYWDLVLDKGTFDAISLGNRSANGSAGANSDPGVEARYRTQVLNLLRPGGRFLITSCNWTEAELCAWMVGDGEDDAQAEAWLETVGRVAYPSFQFGGVQGQTVCTVCFAKRTRAWPRRGSGNRYT